ncbi:uncharacterized protein [Palaemon carinicauda]|uniref:uncharacterized protein n=1 Tax=Palaemon carinicauda TaxID=392227 RepID=UPI0035B677C4
MISSQVASLYDLLGFAVPFILQAKILMRSMTATNTNSSNSSGGGVNWDEPLDYCMVHEWKAFFKNLFGLIKVTFRRPLKPCNAIGTPGLIVFADGSQLAYEACAYFKWQTGEDKFEAKLIVAKNKIAPVRQLTIPQLELCGALISARLRTAIMKEFKWEFESVYHITDSSIVRLQIQKESNGFNTFVAV